MSKDIPDNIFDLCVQLYQDMEGVSMSDEGVVSGILPESYDIDAVEDAISELYIHRSVDSESRRVEFKAPSSSGFCRSLDDLLSHKKNCVNTPDRFFLVQENYLHTLESPPPKDCQLGLYFSTIELIHELIKVADLVIPESSPDKLIFLGNSKLYVSLQYDAADLKALDELDGFAREYIASETHKDQKQEIIKAALIEVAQGRTQISIKELLTKFQELKERVTNNYNLYVAEFSYEKVKSEVVKEKLEAITNLNKVFADIQNQLLALPVGLLLVRGQLENVGAITVKNLIVWVSFLIFSVFMLILLRNQSSTLKAVKSEVDQQKEQFRSKYHSISERFDDDFRDISDRYEKQRITLALIFFVVLVIFFGVTLIAGWYSGIESATKAVDWLINSYHGVNKPS